jgi:hypothetical protein
MLMAWILGFPRRAMRPKSLFYCDKKHWPLPKSLQRPASVFKMIGPTDRPIGHFWQLEYPCANLLSIGTDSFPTILSSAVRCVDGVDMKPSSKISLIGALIFAALWPMGEAGAAARSFGMPAMRLTAPKGVHIIGAGVRPFNVPVERRVRGAVFATPLPAYLAATFPGYAAPGADYEPVTPVAIGQVPPFFGYPAYPPYPPIASGPAAACAPLPGPAVIEVGPLKPARNLPRVVYGTSSLCRG